MQILRVRLENFGIFKKYDEAFGKVTILKGPNGSGKSTLLAAVKAMFRGTDAKKIHDQGEKAEVYVELDGFKASRKITQNGTTVNVVKDGETVKRPQEYLTGVIGNFSFSPVDIFKLKGKELTAAILGALPLRATAKDVQNWTKEASEKRGVDLKKHGLEIIGELRDYYYSLRANANAIVDRTNKTLETLKEKLPAGLKAQPVDTKKLSALREKLSSVKARAAERDSLEETGTRLATDVKDIKAQVKDLQETLAKKETALDQARKDYRKVEVVNEKPIREEVEAMEKAQTVQYELIHIQDMTKELVDADEKARTLDTVVKRLSGPAVEELMERADLPVKGLRFEDGGFYLGKVPISELSTSEKARFGVALVKPLNKKYPVKVLFLDNLETLTPTIRAEYLKAAEKDGWQVILTQATEDTLDLKTVVRH